MSENKREIIFEIPNEPEYRVVCRFGYNYLVAYSWWAHIQRKTCYKKWILFGEITYKWTEVDNCWFTRDFDNREDLRKAALDFFDERVKRTERIRKKAMEI